MNDRLSAILTKRQAEAEANRRTMPFTGGMVDELRASGFEPTVKFANEGGRKAGNALPEGVKPVIAPLARSTDKFTSHEAARRVRESGEVERCMRDVEDALSKHGPMIPARIAEATGRDYHAIQKRGKEMEDAGRIVRYVNNGDRQSTWALPGQMI